MACLLALAAIAMALIMVQPGQLTFAARTSPAEEFWRAALPGAAVPDAILELLHHENDVPRGGKTSDGDDPPPPMNFNYDDYRALPRIEADAAAPSPDVLNRVDAAVVDIHAPASSPPTVFFLEDAVRVGESLPLPRAGTATAAGSAAPALSTSPLRLYTVRSVRAVEGPSFVVCRGEPAVYGCRRATTGPARAYAVNAGGGHGDAASVAAAVLCHTDTSLWDPDHAAFRLLGVQPGGAAVCRAVPNAQILSATKDSLLRA